MLLKSSIYRLAGAVVLAAAALLFVGLATSDVQATGSNHFVAPNASGDCSQLNPCGLQAALSLAQDGDTIYLGAGTYTGTLGSVASILDSIGLLGGWDGAGTGPVVRDPDLYISTIDGEGVRVGMYASGDYTITLDGLYITNGWSPANGGGIQAVSARLLITNSHIYSNSSGAGAAGISIQSSPWATLSGNEIYSNTALGGGAGAFLDDLQEVVLTNNQIYLNKSTHQFSTGGGIYLSFSANAQVSGNYIYSNTAGVGGGGIDVYSATNLLVENNWVYGNRAETPSASGGGLNIASSSLLLTGNTIHHNEASSGAGIALSSSPHSLVTTNEIYSNTALAGSGGGVWLYQSPTSTLTSNAIYGNAALAYGGGVYVQQAPDAVLIGNSVYDNKSQNGGGVDVNQSNGVTLNDNWITDNTGTLLGFGGGIRIASSAEVWLTNNIVAGNQLTGTRSGAGVAVLNDSTTHFLHTTLARNTGGNEQGIFVAVNSMAWLTNTILVSHTIGVGTSASTVTMEATLWGAGAWANGTDTSGPGISIGSINLAAEPSFVDPDAGNYHILGGSAAVNQGIDTGVVLDIDGDVRLGEPDLGADEFVVPVYLPLIMASM